MGSWAFSALARVLENGEKWEHLTYKSIQIRVLKLEIWSLPCWFPRYSWFICYIWFSSVVKDCSPQSVVFPSKEFSCKSLCLPWFGFPLVILVVAQVITSCWYILYCSSFLRFGCVRDMTYMLSDMLGIDVVVSYSCKCIAMVNIE